MDKGKLIVLEGLDGSGKSTQIKLLKEKLLVFSKKIVQIKLPDYESDSSALVKMYLNGDFGNKPENVNVYAASVFYASDRYANYNLKWKQDYLSGAIILADRYTTSNMVHQSVKLPQNEWNGYIEWLNNLEYAKLKIPKPDLVIYLDMPISISQKLMTKRYGDENKKDVHERDLNYLFKCRNAAEYVGKKEGWKKVECANGEIPRTPNEISNDVFNYVLEFLKSENA